MNVDDVARWRADQLRRSAFTVAPITSAALDRWSLQDGRLTHASGGFFSVVGLSYSTDDMSRVYQPFILQPEIGILGFLIRRNGDGVDLLVQAKTEPGTPGGAQLAPSFQCTESNYRQLHGGACAPFYSYFGGQGGGTILLDTLQSEQGTRFVNKYNSNMIVEVADEPDLFEPDLAAWRWLSFSSARDLLQRDLLFNTDARSVLAVADWSFLSGAYSPFERLARTDDFAADLWHSYGEQPSAARLAEIHSWLDDHRAQAPASGEIVPLNGMPQWTYGDLGVDRDSGASVAVRYFVVHARDREVPRWSQPLLTSHSYGSVVLLAQARSGVLKFQLRVSREPGFANRAQLSSSHQLFPGSDQQPAPLEEAVTRWAARTGRSPVIFDCVMSEEGGRFYHDINRYRLVVAPADHPFDDEPDTVWLTLAEITALKQVPGTFTNELRSMLSLLLHYV